MKKFKCIILLILIMINSNASALALSREPYTNIILQGNYKVSERNGDFKPGKYKISLINSDSVSYVYIIDKDCVQRFSKRFSSECIDSKDKENYSLYTEGSLLEGDTIIIFGKGKMYFDVVKSKE